MLIEPAAFDHVTIVTTPKSGVKSGRCAEVNERPELGTKKGAGMTGFGFTLPRSAIFSRWYVKITGASNSR